MKLKAKIQQEISKLTTHIPADNYDATLSKIEAFNLDFLKPEYVNNCIANQFTDCKPVQKELDNLIIKKILKFLTMQNWLWELQFLEEVHTPEKK